MTPIVSFAIQHHPARADLLLPLLAELPDADVVTDPEPAEEPPNPWRTYRRALEQTPAAATHRVVLQDDVLLCDGFRDAAVAAVAARPDRVVALFVGGNARRAAVELVRAARNGRNWVDLHGMTWVPAVALAWPTAMIGPLLAWVDEQNWRGRLRADDDILGRWLRHTRQVACATVPSLADHPDDVPSLLGKRSRGGLDQGRVAACWIGDCDPATIDWTAP